MEEYKQNYLFSDFEKGLFSWSDFEKNALTPDLTTVLRNAFISANSNLDTRDFTDYRKRTIAGAINDIVTTCVDKECRDNNIGTIRNLYERDVLPVGEYLFIFKKYPVSNLETKFANQMANQKVPVHVITVVYKTDEFYNINSVDVQYRYNHSVVYNKKILLNQNINFTVKKTNGIIAKQENDNIKVMPRLKVAKKEAKE